MAKQASGEQVVSFQELAISNAFEGGALTGILERKDTLTHGEVVDKTDLPEECEQQGPLLGSSKEARAKRLCCHIFLERSPGQRARERSAGGRNHGRT